MKIILLKNVENLGSQWDVKIVADGYARNFLVPRGFAALATPAALADAARKKEAFAARAEQDLARVQQLAAALNEYEVTITVKDTDGDALYAAITPKMVSEALAASGFQVHAKQIRVEQPIRAIGEHPALIVFDHGLEAAIKIIVEKIKTKGEKDET